MRPPVVDSIGAWLLDLGPENDAKLKGLEQDITDLGGSLVR
jgi:hypothetical protein